MKTLFKIILLSLFIVITLNAEDSQAKVFPNYVAGQPNWIDGLGNIIQDTIRDLMQKIFENVRNMIHGTVTYTILGCALMLWCLNQLKNGYPTREEMWKVGKWVVMACLILAIFSSYDVFKAFIEYLTIPASWVVTSLDGIFSSQMNGKTISEIAISLFNDIARICSVGFEKTANEFYKQQKSWWSPDGITYLNSYIKTAIWMVPTWLMAMLFYFLGICFVAIIMFSSFMATLLLCFSPILVPFISLPFLKPYFFSWLKLWITYTLIAPIAMLVISIATQSISEISSKQDAQIGEIIWNGHQWVTFITPMITAIMCLYLLTKIPTWLGQILAVQGVESKGLGMGAATASAVGGATAAGAAAKTLGTGGFGSTFMKALPGGTTTGALGGQAVKGLGTLGGKVGAGMQSLGQTISGGNGIMASAGKTMNSMGSATRDFSRSMRRGGENFKSTILNQ
ncbi:MAG: type IV secretion system protein [Campylobacter sp.]|uniref:type IV secretion system protein n=1 Tax=Campylobacter sp. TaxID=205 RepID=UPI002AA667CC|nr:type IV secretion system protein [Campylobacter sp.]MCI7587469.1 type IV secretion system protein [Campylobacter sp.]